VSLVIGVIQAEELVMSLYCFEAATSGHGDALAQAVALAKDLARAGAAPARP
jgi:hypothetical protein